jgi:outer membrane protein assembly factor BamB
MFGYDLARTGYNRAEAGAARYSLAWTADLGPDDYYYDVRKPFVVADGVVVAANYSNQQFIALNAETGAQLWQTDVSGWPTLPTISNGLVYYGTSTDQSILAADLYSGETILSFSSEEDIVGHGGWLTQQPLLVAEQSLFTPGAGWNAASGAIQWWKDFGYLYDLGYQMAYEDGNIYSWGGKSSGGTFFRSLNPKTGGLRWSYRGEQTFSYNNNRQVPVLSQGIAVLAAGDGTMNAIDLATHQFLWSAQNDQEQDGLSAFSAVADGVVYTADGLLLARQLTDGKLLWSFTPDNYDEEGEKLFWNPIVTKNYLYVSSTHQDGQYDRTYVIDRGTHQVVWKTDPAGWLAVANGFLYIISDEDDILYAYRAQEE